MSSKVRRLYVGGLDYGLSKARLWNLLTQQGITPLGAAPCTENGRPLGFGFVTVKREDVERTLKALDGQVVSGRTLTVKLTRRNRGKANVERFGRLRATEVFGER